MGTQQVLNVKDARISVRLVLPSYTTTNRDLLTAITGEIIYNSTTNKINFYSGSAWEAVTSA